MTSSTHEADLKGNMFKRPIHTQSLIVMAFGTEGDKTDQKKPSLKMSTFTAQTYSVLAFHPQDFPEISLLGLGFGQNSGWKMGFGQNLGWEMGFNPPLQDPQTLLSCFKDNTVIPSDVT